MSRKQNDAQTQETPVPEAECPAADDSVVPEEAEESKEPEESRESEKPKGNEQKEPEEPGPEEQLKAEKDRYIRLYAEYENYRKRSQREREGLYDTVKSDTVTKFLPVYDNLERALKLPCQDEAFYKGIKMTMTQLTGVLEALGVKPIETVGKKFDAKKHNAVMHVDDESAGEGEIVEEFQKGFTLGDKVIRFSMVKVAN